ncbi:PLP-dependent cysteine synthase family protein [Sorangium sp. So ce1128]
MSRAEYHRNDRVQIGTCGSIVETIGNTPLVRLRRLSSITTKASVYGKMEYLNPGFSIKDRTALGLIQDAERAGKLKPGDSVVESTSGNMGHALAMLCAARGYRFICIVDVKTPPSNRKICEAFGAEVIVIDQPDESGGYQKARIRKAQEIASARKNCINLDQYGNQAARDAHHPTGREIDLALGGAVDAIIASVSTGGHITGVASYFKKIKREIKVIAVEPEGSAIFGGSFRPFRTNGAGLSFRPGNYDPPMVARELRFSDEEAFAMARRVAREEGILLGGSSGGVLAVAERLIRDGSLQGNIVAVLPDSGLKYLDVVYG